MLSKFLGGLLVIGITTCHAATSLNPVIFINGLGGSVIKGAVHNKTNTPNFLCKKNSDWYTMWINLEELVPFAKDCLMDNLSPRYDLDQDTFSAPDGVELNTNVDFGGVTGLAYLDPTLKISQLSYFGPIIDSLKAKLGYEVGTTLRGAPYDWRMDPGHLSEYYEKLKALIEDSFIINGNKQVILMTHSLGGHVAVYFLNKMTADWKAKYLKAFIPIAAPFGGSPTVLQSLISGYNFGISVFPHDYFWPIQVNSPSAVYLLPTPTLYGKDILVQTPTKSYTGSQLKILVDDLGNQQLSEFFWKVRMTSLQNIGIPMVDTYPFYSTGVQTPVSYSWDAGFIQGTANPVPTISKYDQGDGTVPIISAKVADSWAGAHQKGGFKMQSTLLYNLTHLGMLSDKGAVGQIVNLVGVLNHQV